MRTEIILLIRLGFANPSQLKNELGLTSYDKRINHLIRKELRININPYSEETFTESFL